MYTHTHTHIYIYTWPRILIIILLIILVIMIIPRRMTASWRRFSKNSAINTPRDKYCDCDCWDWDCRQKEQVIYKYPLLLTDNPKK